MPLEQVNIQAKEKRNIQGFEAREEKTQVRTESLNVKDDRKCNKVLHVIRFGFKWNKLLIVISFRP